MLLFRLIIFDLCCYRAKYKDVFEAHQGIAEKLSFLEVAVDLVHPSEPNECVIPEFLQCHCLRPPMFQTAIASDDRERIEATSAGFAETLARS
jgi:hypothetical protein